VADPTLTWQDDVVGDMGGEYKSGWLGPMVEFHMAQSWVVTWQWENAQWGPENQISKIKKAGPPNLATKW
jgi:hypothetical protein